MKQSTGRTCLYLFVTLISGLVSVEGKPPHIVLIVADDLGKFFPLYVKISCRYAFDQSPAPYWDLLFNHFPNKPWFLRVCSESL